MRYEDRVRHRLSERVIVVKLLGADKIHYSSDFKRNDKHHYIRETILNKVSLYYTLKFFNFNV